MHAGGEYHETCEDIKQQYSEGYHEEGRMRRVPDFLPVGVQDFLYRRKPELRKQQPLIRGPVEALHRYRVER